MDRQIVYAGAVPLDTDQLLQSRNTMVSLGFLAKMVLGDNQSYADGLTCSPGLALSVVIAPGSLTCATVVDASFFGALPPDPDPLLKIGINTTSTVLPVVAGTTSLISASFAEVQAGGAVLAYYNASNPTQTLFGAEGNGAMEPTVLQQQVVLSVSSTGVAPIDSVPLWLVNIPAGATVVSAAMISVAPGAPFLRVKLPGAAPLESPAFSGLPTAPTPGVGDVSSLVATTAFVNIAQRRFRSVWTSSGGHSWVCPAGVSQVLFRGWGPGGAGGTGISGYPGGGGGGGGYLEVLLDVKAGQAYAVVVGTGGTSSSSVTPTGFGGILSVFGGGNGGNGGSGASGSGGTAGSDAVLQVEALSNPGTGIGQSGYSIGGMGIGGAGGGSFGTPPSYPTTGGGVGSPGFWPGGGGSGGCIGAGGVGAAGLVILEWSSSPASG